MRGAALAHPVESLTDAVVVRGLVQTGEAGAELRVVEEDRSLLQVLHLDQFFEERVEAPQEFQQAAADSPVFG